MRLAHPKTLLMIALLLAAALRIAYFVSFQSGYEFADHLHLDPRSYHEQGLSVAAGFDPMPGQPFYQSPLYAYFLGSIYRLLPGDLAAVRLVQVLLGVSAVFFIALATMKLFGTGAGVLAAFLAALYAPFLFYEMQIMKPALGVCLIAGGILASLFAAESARAAILAGLAFGLSALVRENLMLLLPVGFVWILLQRKTLALAFPGGAPLEGASLGRARIGRVPIGRVPLGRALLFLAAGAAVILPITVRNFGASGEWIVVTSQGGQNFYIGNNPAARGYYTDLPFVRPDPRFEQQDFRREGERRAGGPLSFKALSRLWYGEGVRWIRENPADAWKLLQWKLLHLGNDQEIPDNEHFGYMRARFPVLRFAPLTFGWLFPFALLGMIAGRGHWRERGLLYAGVLVQALSLVGFYVFARYRLAIVPFLIPFAAHGMMVLAGVVWRRDKVYPRRMFAQIAVALLLGLGFAWAFQPAPAGFDADREGMLPLHVNRGMLYEERDAFEDAAVEYEAALAIDSENAFVQKRYGRALG
ncbi:MAG: hypothetical protein HKN20_07535, partial [Gemmatimonadetes bacterium]|nr:hypothetical protein [Gemmatimonadota bacterium]